LVINKGARIYKGRWEVLQEQINFSFRTYQNLVFMKLNGFKCYEFMNSDEYLGGMSSDRPLKAFVPGGSSVPFYLLI
jgi:hypothetical protein